MRININCSWYRLRAGCHTMSAWVGDDQLTYLAVRGETGWVVTRNVAGAGVTVLGEPTVTLRAAKALAQADLDIVGIAGF
jgi:hypothetical protein